ncbi:MAG: lysylphosphatidylglycerol synthase domain-containing protein [Candidatus Omnitrophota bacterium]
MLLKKRNIIFSMFISSVLLIVICSRFRQNHFISYIQHTDLTYILEALVMSFVSVPLLSSMVWQNLLLASRINVPFKDALAINSSIAVFKILMPFYLGEFSRVVYLERHYGFSRKDGISISFIYLALGFLSRFSWAIGAFLILGLCKLKGLIFCSSMLPIDFPGWLKRYGVPLPCFVKLWGLSVLSFSAQIMTFYLISCSLHLKIQIFDILLCYPLIDLMAKASFCFKGFGAREGLIIFFFGSYGAPELLFLSGFISSFFIELVSPMLGIVFLPSFFQVIFSGNRVYDKQ